jgi:hypothetical protein
MTHSTWDIVLVQTTGIYAASRDELIFSSKDSGSSLETWLIFFINRITCQAYIIWGTTPIIIMRSSNVTYKINKNLFKFVMENSLLEFSILPKPPIPPFSQNKRVLFSPTLGMWNYDVCNEWDTQDFNFRKHIFGKFVWYNELSSNFALKKWE